jgi:hypothetical protein
MIDQKKYVILPPKHATKGRRSGKSIYQEEIEKALWKLGVNYYRLTKEEEETILKIANKY